MRTTPRSWGSLAASKSASTWTPRQPFSSRTHYLARWSVASNNLLGPAIVIDVRGIDGRPRLAEEKEKVMRSARFSTGDVPKELRFAAWHEMTSTALISTAVTTERV